MTGQSKPLSTETFNAGFDNRWTSPCCYEELTAGTPGTYRCPVCGRAVRCTLESQPVCHAELIEDEEEDAA